MNQPNQFQFEWITDWDKIYSDSFQQQWLNWYTEALESHVFFHPALGMAWIDTYRKLRDIKPLFCIARQDKLLIFLPLIHWRKNWKNAFQRVIVPVGYSDFDYHDPICVGSSEKIADQFYQELTEQIQQNFSFDKLMIDGIRSNINLKGWKQEADICPYCNLSETDNQAAFLKSLKTSLRGDLNRQMRRLNEQGNVELYNYSVETLDQALQTLPKFLELHAERWPKAYKAPGFHQTLLVNGITAGIVDFSELRVEGKAVSWHLGFIDKSRYYYYMPVIQQDFASLSPGKVHLLYLVNRAIENKIQIFDHLRGDENYKAGWTNNMQQLYTITLHTSNNSGLIRNWLVEHAKKIIR